MIRDISRAMITSDKTIRDAMSNIEHSGFGIALVIDENQHLVGVLTDADIRRYILSDKCIDDSINSYMNKSFVSGRIGDSIATYKRKLMDNNIYQLPVIDDDGVLVDLILFSDFNESFPHDNWVVIMAGGMGARLMPLTKDVPKPMLKLGNKPILETLIERLKMHGYRRFILSVNYLSDVIEDYFGDGSLFDVEIIYVKEKKQLGTAGSLRLAQQYLTEPFIVINGDLLTTLNFRAFMKHHMENRSEITVAVRRMTYKIPYGVVELNDKMITTIEEKPEKNVFISTGMYCLNPDIINKIPENSFFDITELIELEIKTHSAFSYLVTEYWLDIGRLADYEIAIKEFTENLHRFNPSEAKVLSMSDR